MVHKPVDTGALSMTEPHPAPIFDTGPHPDPLESSGSDIFDSDSIDAVDYTPPLDSGSFPRAGGGVQLDVRPVQALHPPPAAARPFAVPSQFQFVKRWKFALLLAGVWSAAAAVGAGLYYWWFHSIDKTWPDAGVLLFVIVCVVAALLVSMAETRPLLSSLSLALMSAPYAAACGAGVLYGAYAFRLVVP